MYFIVHQEKYGEEHGILVFYKPCIV